MDEDHQGSTTPHTHLHRLKEACPAETYFAPAKAPRPEILLQERLHLVSDLRKRT
jgi:hypothetical protein